MLHSALRTFSFAAITAASLLSVAATLLLLPILHSQAATDLCPNIDETIDNCKARGLDYQLNTRADGCKVADCIAIGFCPVFKDEVRTCRQAGLEYEEFWDERRCHRARCVTPANKSSDAACPMSWDIAKRKIQNCEAEAGYKAITSQTATCTVFLGCERSGGNMTPADVACRKRIENNCTIIKCEDGFTWNSCGSASSVSSSTPIAKEDPCLEIQLAAKQADEAFRIKRRDTDLRNKRNSLNVQLRQCRLEAKKKGL